MYFSDHIESKCMTVQDKYKLQHKNIQFVNENVYIYNVASLIRRNKQKVKPKMGEGQKK